jgi:8-oxo-dGTP pyrophosphatase MutT (NUDIX family)
MAEGRFQVAVGAIIRHDTTGKILLIHRTAKQVSGNIWEYPVGRTKQFETLADGLKREVAEETGLTSIDIERPFSTFEFMRGEHAAENEVRAIVYAATTDQDSVQLSDEHDDYQWLTIDEAIALADHSGVKTDLERYRDIYVKP